MIKPDFGDIPEIQTTVTMPSSSSSSSSSASSSSSSSSSLTELVVVGGIVTVAMTAFLYFTSSLSSTESKKPRKKGQKKKKKRIAQKNAGKKKVASANVVTAKNIAPQKAPSTATPVANNTVFKNLLRQPPAREIRQEKPVCTVIADWNIVEQALLQRDVNRSVQAFMLGCARLLLMILMCI